MKKHHAGRILCVLLGMLLFGSPGFLFGKPKNKQDKGKGPSWKSEEKQEKKAGKSQKPGGTGRFEYDYFPAHQVYYNRTTKTYFWIDSGTWREGRHLPGNYTVGGERVKIRMGGENPYEYHRINYERLPYSEWKKPYAVRRGPPAHAPAWGYRRKFDYTYYPDYQVFYDTYEKNYLWLKAGKIQVGYELPDWMKVDPARGVTVELDRAVDIGDFKGF